MIVHYREDLSEGDRLVLRQYVESGAQFMIAAPDPEQSEALRALTSATTLTCEEFDSATLAEFSEGWLAQLTQPAG